MSVFEPERITIGDRCEDSVEIPGEPASRGVRKAALLCFNRWKVQTELREVPK
jgi:hypothetical protein